MGRPEDVAQAVLFLAGDASDYITGQVLWWTAVWHVKISPATGKRNRKYVR